MEIDRKTEEPEKVDYARFQIRTAALDPIALFRKLRINNFVYGVSLVEEIGEDMSSRWWEQEVPSTEAYESSEVGTG